MLLTRCSFLVCCLFFFCVLFQARAGELDSLERELAQTKDKKMQSALYAQISFVQCAYSPEKALSLAAKGLSIALEINAPLAYAQCCNSMGWAYYRLGNNDSGEIYLKRAIAIFRRLNVPLDEGRSLSNLSSIYESRKQYEKTLPLLMRAKMLMELSRDESGKAYTEKQLGIIYRKQGYFAEAEKYFKSALSEFEKLGFNNYSADVLSSLGSLYLERGNADSTFWCYRHAIEKIHLDNIKKGISNKNGMAYAYESLGNAFFRNKDTHTTFADSALYYFQKAHQLFLELNNRQDASYEKLRIGDCLIVFKKYDEAEALLKGAKKVFDSLHAANYIYETCKLLSLCYKAKGDFKSALDYEELSGIVNDTLNIQNRNATLADMLTKYESEKKDRTIALLDAKRKLTDKELSRNRIIIIFSSFLIFLTVLLGVTLFNRYRIKQQLKEVELRNQLANDLHDDIGSSLSSIVMLSRMASSKALAHINNHEEVIRKIGQNAQEVMDKIGDIVWTTNPKFDEGNNLRDKVEKYLLQARKTTDVTISYSISDEVDRLRFPMETRKNIFLILKEAVNNALKYAGAAEILVEIRTLGKKLTLSITDDGKGMEMDKRQWGNGLYSMHERAEALCGKLTINSLYGQGTSVVLDISVPSTRHLRREGEDNRT